MIKFLFCGGLKENGSIGSYIVFGTYLDGSVLGRIRRRGLGGVCVTGGGL